MRAAQETKGIPYTNHNQVTTHKGGGCYIQATREAQTTRQSVQGIINKGIPQSNTTTTINFNKIEMTMNNNRTIKEYIKDII
jgi:hypothetical protein